MFDPLPFLVDSLWTLADAHIKLCASLYVTHVQRQLLAVRLKVSVFPQLYIVIGGSGFDEQGLLEFVTCKRGKGGDCNEKSTV